MEENSLSVKKFFYNGLKKLYNVGTAARKKQSVEDGATTDYSHLICMHFEYY